MATTIEKRSQIEWAFLASGGSGARAAERLEGISAHAVRIHIFKLRQAQGLTGEDSTPPELDIQKCLRLAREGKDLLDICCALSWPVEIVEACLSRWAEIGAKSEARREAVERRFTAKEAPATTAPVRTVDALLRDLGVAGGVVPPPELDELDDEMQQVVRCVER